MKKLHTNKPNDSGDLGRDNSAGLGCLATCISYTSLSPPACDHLEHVNTEGEICHGVQLLEGYIIESFV